MLRNVSDPVPGVEAEDFWQLKNQTSILKHMHYEILLKTKQKLKHLRSS